MNTSRQVQLHQLREIARRVAGTLGLEVVELVFHSRGKHSQLRIDIDRPSPSGVGIRDCEALSRALDEDLERVEFFDAPYELQVSSPGIDRPIRSTDDIRRNTGRRVRVEFRGDDDRIGEAVGILGGLDAGGAIILETSDGRRSLDPPRILMMKQEVTPHGRGKTESGRRVI